MNATRRDLEIQFNRVKTNGWLGWFQREAKRAHTTTAHLLGIGSRETNLKNIKGDYRGGIYHGFGIMQVDIGTDPEYCRHWTPENVEPSIRRGVDIYLKKVSQIVHGVGIRSLVGGRSFIGKAVEDDDIRRIATAAYNCGLWAYCHFSRGENVDSTTTGHDYSRDVYDRAVEFADILENAGIEPNARALEIEAQGKYARGYAKRVQLPVAEPQEAEDELVRADYGRDEEEVSAAVPPFDSTIDQQIPQESATPKPATEQPPTNQETPTQVADQIINTGDIAPTNVQDVNEPATVQTTVYQGTGLFGVLKKDFTAIGGGNVGFQSLNEYAQQASGWPPWVIGIISKLAIIAIIVGVGWLLFRLVHYLAWRFGEWKRQRLQADINSDVTRKNISFE